ncbi:MAG: DUF2213 domain-containing protein [Burkholderiales bacterium]|nr:DUF2213 domain-containing protein [Burkholderiales bacterium]
MKQQTHDRGRYYTTADLGAKRSTTPEGFLVCHDVPIARTGTQLYTAAEVPIDPGPDGLIRVERPPEEVFRPETIASFEGKPITVEHPNDFVTPENYRSLSVGFTQNVRRGQGIEDDLMVADIVITDAAAIKYVNEELPEVSAGYEAVYQQTDAGRGVQREIVGNHVALVERGRAGPRCSIQDKEPMMKSTPKKRTWMDRLRTAFKAQDEAAMEEALEEANDAEVDPDDEDDKAKTGDAAWGQILKQLTKLTGDVDALKKRVADADEETEEERKKREAKETDDTVVEAETGGHNPDATAGILSGDSLKAVISRAEILAPGIAVPTGDSAQVSAIEALQRKAVAQALTTDSGKAAVHVFTQGRDLSTLTGDALAAVFNGSAELIRVQNNDAGARRSVSTKDFGLASSVSVINARNREYWANRK